MMLSTWTRFGVLLLLASAGIVICGCSGENGKGANVDNAASPANDSCAVAGWCTEHGVPEEICAQCNAKLAAEYQRKGDWCKEHNRPESQCFLCNPKLADRFVADYETKYGKKPPKAERK
jgi:hypothetical protein